MKILVLLLATVLLLSSCETGQKALQEGKYDVAVMRSTGCLSEFPKYKKPMQVLRTAYPIAESAHWNNVAQFQQETNDAKWEKLLTEYNSLILLQRYLKSCQVCSDSIITTPIIATDYDSVRTQASEIKYNRAQAFMDVNSIESLQLAYQEFDALENINPNYKDVRVKMEEIDKRIMARTPQPVYYSQPPMVIQFGGRSGGGYAPRGRERERERPTREERRRNSGPR